MAYIGRTPIVGNFVILDSISATATDTFALTSASVAYAPQSANHCIVSLNGVIQAPINSFTISGTNIVFASALTTDDTIDFIQVLGDVLNIGTPSDGTVGIAKLSATGTKDASTFLRGDNTFATVSSYTDSDALTLFNASGSAPVYACRAWVNFNGTGTVAIRASGNVSSITDNGVGDYTVNFTTAMQDADFCVTGVAKRDSLNEPGIVVPTVYAAGSARILTGYGSFTLSDSNFVNVAIFR